MSTAFHWFVIRCVDAPGRAALRAELAAAHRGYVERHFDAMALGGPLLDANGERCGSLIVIRLADVDAARRFIEDEPYHCGGLFAQVTIDRFDCLVRNDPDGGKR